MHSSLAFTYVKVISYHGKRMLNSNEVLICTDSPVHVTARKQEETV